jgi:hypothetical protein
MINPPPSYGIGQFPNMQDDYGMSSKSNGFLIHSNKGRDERALYVNGGVRLEELVTLSIIKGTSTSGPIKKMLHVPTLTIMTLKEIPL